MENLEKILDPNNWNTKLYLDNLIDAHLEKECSKIISGYLILAPISEKMNLHIHLDPKEKSFDDVLELLEKLEDFYLKKSLEIEKASDKVFNKIFNSPFLEKAPPEAIRKQIEKFKNMGKESDRYYFHYLIVLNQEIAYLNAAIKAGNTYEGKGNEIN